MIVIVRQCKAALRYAILLEKESDDPIWMCSLPVYHFLTHQCKPFQDKPDNYDYGAENHKWWGIMDIKDTIEYLKGKTKWSRYKTSIHVSVIRIILLTKDGNLFQKKHCCLNGKGDFKSNSVKIKNYRGKHRVTCYTTFIESRRSGFISKSKSV